MASLGLKRHLVPAPATYCQAPLTAIRHVRSLPGGTQPHLMLAGDGRRYVVKFRNNPIHPRILANEWLATRIALSLGLPMQPVEIIEVSDWLISHSPQLRVEIGEYIVPCSGGLQLASLYAADSGQGERILQCTPDAMPPDLANREAFTLALPFDKWAGNCDNRQALFVRRHTPPVRCDAVFVDQSYCFNAAQWTFPDLPFAGAYDHDWVYAGVTGWDSFEPTLSRLEAIDIATLWNQAVEVPQEWYQHDAKALSLLIETLHRRRLLVRDLITCFRHSARNPFPDWRS